VKDIQAFINENKDPKMFTMFKQAVFRQKYKDDISAFNNRLDRCRSDLQLSFSLSSVILQEDKEARRDQDLSDLRLSTETNLKLIFDEVKGSSSDTNDQIHTIMDEIYSINKTLASMGHQVMEKSVMDNLI
jgi:hypothetical protein